MQIIKGVLILALLMLAVISAVGFFIIDPQVKFINTTDHNVSVSIRQGPLGNALRREVEPFAEYTFRPNGDHAFYLFASKVGDHIKNCKFEFESCCDDKTTSCKKSDPLFSSQIRSVHYLLNDSLKTTSR